MARRNPIKTTRKRHYTKTKAEREQEREVMKLVLGDEIADDKLPLLATDHNLYAKTLHWYNQVVNIKEARGFLEDFLESINNKHYEAITRVPDVWICTTACWIARLLSRGAKLPETSVPFFKRKLLEMVAKAGAVPDDTQDEEAKAAPVRPTIQANIRTKAGDLIFEIEKMIDTGQALVNWSAYKWLTDQKISSPVASKIVEKFVPVLAELTEAAGGMDQQLNEGYQYVSRKSLLKTIEFYKILIDDVSRIAGENKPIKIRKARPIDPAKKVARIKPMAKYEPYDLVSIDPKKILTASELWVYNTSWNTLTVFRAQSNVLDVKKASIVGWDPRSSECKNLGRDAGDTLKAFMKGSKAYVRKMFDDLKTKKGAAKKKVNARIADNVVLLRVL